MDSDQYVPIVTVANLDHIKKLSTDVELIVDILRCERHAFKVTVLCTSYFSWSSIRTRHCACLPERAACQENLIRVNFYQYVVGVDFPGEVVKVHPAESYLLVFDLCSYLVYCLN